MITNEEKTSVLALLDNAGYLVTGIEEIVPFYGAGVRPLDTLKISIVRKVDVVEAESSTATA